MKTMSQVLKLSDCAETLEEARSIIDRQQQRISELEQDRERLTLIESLVSSGRGSISIEITDADNIGIYYRDKFIGIADTLSAAIDAARKEQP